MLQGGATMVSGMDWLKRLSKPRWAAVTVVIAVLSQNPIVAEPFGVDQSVPSVLAADEDASVPTLVLDDVSSAPVETVIPEWRGGPEAPVELETWDATSCTTATDDGISGAHGQHGCDCHGSACGRYGCLDQPGLFQFLRQCHDKNNACWVGRADALVLWRNAPSSRPLFSTVTPETQQLGPTALNASDLNSDALVAPRISLLRTDCDGETLEATYLYAGNFYSERSLPFAADGYATSPPGIYGNTWGPPDTSLDSATAKLLGQLQSLEFNARHCIWSDTCQFLIGTRWLQWNETLQMQDSFAYAEPTPVTGRDFYETECFNNLWGGQIGLDTLLLGRVGMARIEGLVKAGAYYNAAGQASSYRYVLSDGSTFANQARAGGPAACSFVGEVGMTAVLPISCNCDFRCGYFGLWMTNLAQPARQLSGQTINQFSSVARLDTVGTAVLQGLSLGFENRW